MEHNAEQAQAVISAGKLTKVFRDFWRRPVVSAVNAIDFTVKPGEIFGLLGPNGSGKSTTLRMVLGLLKPSSGKLEVFGKEPQDIQTKSRIGYLPEESHLYPFLTAGETLKFYGSLFDLDASTLKSRAQQLLEMTGLTHASERRVGEFSKGMLRRIGLAQALVNDPELVILDEPTSGLDPVGCRQVKDLILTLAKRGKTIIISSHLLADVESVCQRVIIMNNGKIIVGGHLNELLKNEALIRFCLPAASADQVRAIKEFLLRQTGNAALVDHPRKTLEQFFLETVAGFQPEAKAPSGVAYAEKIAPFLAGQGLAGDKTPCEK